MFLPQIIASEVLQDSTQIVLHGLIEHINNLNNEINKLNRLNDNTQPCKMFTTPKYQIGEWVCSECHTKFNYSDNTPLKDTIHYCWHCGRKIVYWVKL